MGIQYNPKVVTDGLVFYVDAANKRSYPGTGTTWTDLKGGNNGTFNNMDAANFSNDNAGSLSFDGTDEYVEFANSQSQSGLTLSAWCNFDSTVLINSHMISVADETLTHYTSLQWKNLGNVMYLTARQFDGTGRDATEASSSNDDEWHHVVGVFNGASQVLYVDGVQTATNTATPSLTTTTRGKIGVTADSTPTGYFQGKIQSAQIYNRALSAAEIKQNYLATKGRYK